MKKFFFLAVVALALMLVPSLLDMGARALTGSSLIGAVELTEICLAALVFASLAYVQKEGSHLTIEFFHKALGPQTRAFLAHTINLVGFLFFAVMAVALVFLAYGSRQGGETTFMLALPLWGIQLLGALGIFLLAFVFGQNFLFALRPEKKQNITEYTTNTSRSKNKKILYTAGSVVFVLALMALVFAGRAGVESGTISPAFLGGVGMLGMLALLFLGFPLGLAMTLTGALGMLAVYPTGGPAFYMLAFGPYSAASNYVYAVIPMFLLMGEWALVAGISRDLFKAASAWLGGWPAGLAVASVAGCAGFAAVSGDSMATSITMASVALPDMEKHGYKPAFAAATLAAGGTLGILIPPSTGFIFYSLVTETSLTGLFLAGVIPGLLLALLFCVVLVIMARLKPGLAPAAHATSWSTRWQCLMGLVPMLGLIVLVLVAILGGLCSPNEGGALGAAGTGLYALVTRRATLKDLGRGLVRATRTTSRLLFMLMGVSLLGTFFAATALPAILAEYVATFSGQKYVVLAFLVIFYALLGCVLNVVPMIMLTLPALYPAMMALGFDPLWLGVVVVILMEMGQISPPVGLNVYGMGAVARHVSVGEIFRYVWPFMGAMLVLVLVLTLFPTLATWLPTHFM